MRRRAWIALSIAVVLLLGIVLFVRRTSDSRSGSRVEGGERSSVSRTSKGSRADKRVSTRDVAGTVFLDDVPASGATVRIVARRGVFHARSRPMRAVVSTSGRFRSPRIA